MRCHDCATDHDHCHELLVLHADGAADCADCGAAGRDTHDWRQPCAERCCAAA